MSRAEFSKKVKRAAFERSGGNCEASGHLYGMTKNSRCWNSFKLVGVEFDHVILEANSHDNSLENCLAVCKFCHRRKTAKYDIPLAAKTLRQQDKHRSIKRSSCPMPGSRASGFKKKMSGEIERR